MPDASSREPMSSREDVLIFIGNRVLVGELDVKNVCLRHALELVSQQLPVMDAAGNIVGLKVMNQVIPLFGFSYPVTISLTEATVGAAIRFADLNERDATELAQKMQAAQALIDQQRAAKSGIVVTKEMPRP